MGAGENAHAWKNKQDKPEDYEVIGPHKYDTRQTLKPHPVRVFLEAGKGNINLGENPCYAEESEDQEIDVGRWVCSAEGDAVVAYVVKKE
ncbi:hypothetical protein DL98DRAFT_595274 [Cadophora sp. DSE1049]|nr:hypothetical protein DL98DRAFT_595274 [Cadophora sp. DSE1049]